MTASDAALAGNNRAEMISGIRTALPILLGALPFGMLFGVAAIDGGLSLFQTMLMSMTIYAGASQLVGLQLFQHDVPAWLIVASVFAVNFRHILYSAALAKYLDPFSVGQKLAGFFLLVDPQFTESLKRAENGTRLTFIWYLSFALTFYIPWQTATLIGALFGKMIGDPKPLGLDVLLSVYFLGMVLGFRRKPNWLPIVAVSAVFSVLAWHWIGSPWNVSIGALAGIAVAASLPIRSEEASV